MCDILYELDLNYNQMLKMDQKGQKNEEKGQVSAKKLYFTIIMTLINAIFSMFAHYIYMSIMIIYTN